ncbi:hypothetical protein [Streptomyces poonensis]|uniref:Uncharacterized protein n=1 Tax=Streptomyces poonensis TaxID=68255 RepID=A0A918PVG5_9ACTN|nr:hypothetical protein [Streptomyces poonensis]GGZ24277.1 hypothetical protein GCM10010365_50660 [Streptomyces poonensis]GLJ89951.1 hypothetical protein GCM10017589_25520 [Streptomyces poonensis]
MVDDSSDEGSPPGSGSGISRRRILEIVGAAAAVTGVIIGVIQIWPEPSYTIQDWGKEANAVCAKTQGGIEKSERDKDDALERLGLANMQGIATRSDYIFAGNSFYDMAGLVNMQAADLSEIRTPNSRADETKEVSDELWSLSHKIYRVAEVLRSVDMTSPNDALTEFDALAKEADRQSQRINESLRKLGARNCLPAP